VALVAYAYMGLLTLKTPVLIPKLGIRRKYNVGREISGQGKPFVLAIFIVKAVIIYLTCQSLTTTDNVARRSTENYYVYISSTAILRHTYTLPCHALPISYKNENKRQVLRRPPAGLQLFFQMLVHCLQLRLVEAVPRFPDEWQYQFI
jgi:hypothetical protein